MHRNFLIEQRLCFDFPGSKAYVEIDGSPKRLIYQPEGVLCTVNSGGPAYHAINDVVYTSEFSEYANYITDGNCGEC